jgi:hypothetical protein
LGSNDMIQIKVLILKVGEPKADRSGDVGHRQEP